MNVMMKTYQCVKLEYFYLQLSVFHAGREGILIKTWLT